MQGRIDKRACGDTLRNENKTAAYFDSLVNEAARFYAPYAQNFAVIGRGNHEGTAKKVYGTDLTERLVALLNRDTGSTIHAGGYTHWLRICLSRQKQRLRHVTWWTHGYGGGGPVTQDMIQGQRQRAYIEGADVMLSGHTHDSWSMDCVKVRLNHNGQVERKPLLQAKLPTYLQDYEQPDGWSHETGKPPKPLGAYWLRLWFAGHKSGLEYELTRAR